MDQPPPPPGLPPQPPQQPPPGYYQPPPPPPKPPIDKSQIRPRWWWLGLAGGILVLGVAAAIVFFVIAISSISDLEDDFQDFNAPGAAEVRLDAGEEYGVYARSREFDSADSGELPPGAEDVSCEITDVSRERTLTERASSSADFVEITINSVRYDKLLEFSADDAGRYRVDCRDASSPENRVPLALGPPINLFGFVGSILAVFLIPSVTFLIALTILIVVLVMRHSSRKRLEREALEAQTRR